MGTSWQPKRLKAVHYEIMQRVLSGQPQTEIAKEMGMDRTHLNTLIKSDLFQGELQKQIQDNLDKAKQKIRGASEEAVKLLMKLMKESKNDAVRLNAAKELLDRANLRGDTQDGGDTTSAETVLKELNRQRSQTIVPNDEEHPTSLRPEDLN